ncbi:MAG: hypothetical protein O3C57_02710 [Verrucomicrobia bacterium]|nr:hypothetical protein [Verrucomicrobiota bacterium]
MKRSPLENVTIEEVKTYVEAERKRSRRALIWTSTLLFCVFLFFTIVFLSLGLFLVRENRGLSGAVNALQELGEGTAQGVASFSNGINAVYLALDNVDDRVDLIEKSKTSIHQEYDALLVDVQRIKEAFGSTDEKIEREAGVVSDQINILESQIRNEITELRVEFMDTARIVAVDGVGQHTSESAMSKADPTS